MTGIPAAGDDPAGADVENTAPEPGESPPPHREEPPRAPEGRDKVGPVVELDPEPRYLEAQDTGPITVVPPPPLTVPPRVAAPAPREVDAEPPSGPPEPVDRGGSAPAPRRGPSDAPTVLAVLITRTGSERTAALVTAVTGQTRVPDDVVVVDAVPASAERRRQDRTTEPSEAKKDSASGGLAPESDPAADPETEDPESTDLESTDLESADSEPVDSELADPEPADPGSDPAPSTTDLLAGIPVWQILRLSSRTVLADAVRAAVMASDVRDLAEPELGSAPAAASAVAPPAEWIWVLPDDGIPAPDALELLLAAVETAPSVGVAGAKQICATDDQRLWEVGFTTSRRGIRVTGIDRHEVDQGQHDHRCDVLAVTGAGMLIRRDVWDTIGGFDAGLAGTRDDLDLCRRARLAGFRVIVVPAAVISRAGRPVTPGGAIMPVASTAVRGAWSRADRYDALYLRLATVAWPRVPFTWLSILPAAILRMIPLFLARQPGRAWHELLAAIMVLAHPHRWQRSRMRSPHRRGGRRALRPLLASRRDLWRQRREMLADRFGLPTAAASRVVPGTGSASSPAATGGVGGRRAQRAAQGTITVTGEGDQGGMPEERLQIRAAGPRLVAQTRRSILVAPLPVLVVTAVAGIVASWRLLGGSGTIAGPFLLPAPSTSSELWRLVSSPLRSVGLGTRAAADPFAELLTLLSAPPGVSPRLVLLVLLIAAVPLSALTAWIAAGQVVRVRAVRIWAAGAWAAGPPLLVAVGSARPAAAVAHIVLPLVALSLTGAVGGLRGGRHGRDGTQRPRGSLAAAAAAGLTLSVLLAAAPSLAVAAFLTIVCLAVISPGRRRYLLVPVVVVGIALAPWWMAVVRNPRLLVADPGQGSYLGSADGSWWHLLGLPGTPGSLFGDVSQDLSALSGGGITSATIALVLALLAGVGVLILGLIGLLRAGAGRTGAVLGWTVGLLGLGTALVAERIPVANTAAGNTVGFTGPGLSVLVLGAVVAALAGSWTAGDRPRRRGSTRADLVTGLVTVLAMVSTVLVLAAWSWQGATTTDHTSAVGGRAVELQPFTGQRVDPDVLPEIAAIEAVGPAATRTLVLRVTESQVQWNLAHSAGPRLGQDSAAAAAARLDPASDTADAALVVPVIGDLLSDSGRDARPELADLGIGSILLLAPVGENNSLALDSSPGLERVLSSEESILWRVGLDGGTSGPTRPSYARILAADGTPLTALSLVDNTVRARVPEGAEGRRLVLSTRTDGGWSATIDGTPLVAGTDAGWAQSFRLPAEGGQVIVTYRDLTGQRLMLLREIVLGLALLLAFPWPRLRRRVTAPPRPSRPVPRGMETEVDGSIITGPRPRIFDEDYPDPERTEPVAAEDQETGEGTTGVVLESLPPVPERIGSEGSEESATSWQIPHPPAEPPVRLTTPMPEDPLDALSGGFVDWAAVHLPETDVAEDPGPGSGDAASEQVEVIDLLPEEDRPIVDVETDIAVDVDVEPDIETDVDVETDVEAETDLDVETDVEAETDVEPEIDTEVEVEAALGADLGADTDTDTEAGFGVDTDADADAGAGSGTDADTDASAETTRMAGPASSSGHSTGEQPEDEDRTEIALPDDEDSADEADPVPVFPGVDPEELEGFEPYRPSAGRPFYRSAKDRP